MKFPTVYQLKPAFQGILRPIVRWLAKSGITANQVTVLAIIVSALQGIWIYYQPSSRWALLCLPLTLFVRMALNAMDGMLAREHHQKSRLGGILNELGDVLSDTVLFLPLAMHPAISIEIMVIFVILAILTEFTGVMATAAGTARRYDGPMGKSDRAFFLGTVGFVYGIGIPFNPWINYVLGVSLVLLLLTILNRARRILAP